MAGDFVTLSKQKTVVKNCCKEDHIISCNLADVHPDSLTDGEIKLPGDLVLSFKNYINNSPNSYFYGSNDGEAVITFNPNTNGFFGHAMTADGGSYVLEFCGAYGHVWKSYDTKNMEGDLGLTFPGANDRLAITFESEPEHQHLDSVTLTGVEYHEGGEELEAINPNIGILAEPEAEITPTDNTTVVTYSVMFYYTAEVAADTADLEGFFDQIIAETNAGYENSEIPLRIKKHCSAQLPSSFPELGATSLLNNITYWNSDPATTRNGADVAAVISLNLDYCGVAWFNQLSSGFTFSVTKKSCATGYYSFGHEIGHNIGAQHNPEASTNTVFSYAHGHLIQQGVANTGARTIMAYSATGHSTRVNYWSNPNVNHPTTGTPTGVAELSNNAALLTLRRYTLASIADESTGGCNATTTGTTGSTNTSPVTTPGPAPVTPPPPPPPPVTKPPTIPSNGEIKCRRKITSFQSKKTQAKNPDDCQRKCQNNFMKGCVAFNFTENSNRNRCELLIITTKRERKSCYGIPFAGPSSDWHGYTSTTSPEW